MSARRVAVHCPEEDKGAGRATITIRVRDRAMADALERGIRAALAALTRAREPAPRTVRFRTRRRLEALEGAGEFEGAVALLPVTRANGRRLAEYAARATDAGALGVQLVWDGVDPPREAVEKHVFAALERAREKRAPIFLARGEELCRPLTIIPEERR